MIPQQIRYELAFPDPRDADESGIVAFGGDLSPSRLLLAYRSGIFPWYSKGDPILWWSPDPRFILNLEDFVLRRSLRKRLKHFEIRFNTAFGDVVRACATTPRPGQEGSWILPEMVEAYEVLHAMGHAHSVEAWQEGRLVGGLYGVEVGGMFCGESMFAHVSDASKAAFAALVEHLKARGFEMIDAQVPTEHLKSLGAIEVSRDYFLMRLEQLRDKGIMGFMQA
ncbi:leucyl/phenylalanyl-tRNA--protein transferase [Sulfurimonas sp. HSL-1656]|uniref:leucyl/phenylalanyl-tRNA--protein transferase n=1 Tax=Thiomicrolovo subterrani TaxID=3131934 RepID=UPI0031F83DED